MENNYNPFSLKGKVILVTGASSGIGRSTAIECSKLGAMVIITARNKERLQDTYDNLSGEGHVQIIADLTNNDDIEDLINQIPQLDGLVNNAGVSIVKLFSFIKDEDLENTFKINTYAPFILTRQLVKKKKLNKKASIVITSSLASMVQSPGNSVYGMTKSAIQTFARYCALEVASKKIRCNTVHPGMVQTEMVENLLFSKEELEQDKKKYPLKRYGKPEEIAWAIIYLLSDASEWITGTSIVVDGGVHLI